MKTWILAQILFLTAACAAIVSIFAQGRSPLLELVTAEQDLITKSGCVAVHHIWKAQVLAIAGPPDTLVDRLTVRSFRPFERFWAGYLGDEAAFRKWAAGFKSPIDDSRGRIPADFGIPALIFQSSSRMQEFARRQPCGEWFIAYGPGWTNLGGLGPGRMVIDVYGLNSAEAANELRFAMPHEINHLLFASARKDDPVLSTLFGRIVDEGFAAYVADQYWGAGYGPAESLGYSETQWARARERESEIWKEAQALFGSTDSKVINRFAAANEVAIQGGPPKAGYYLGYRIVEDYVQRHGPSSWRRLYELPLERLEAESRHPR